MLAYSASRMSSTRSSRSAPWPGAGPASVVDAFFRSSRSADSPRANTASVMPVSGTPSPRASTAVQVPVPFCSAWSTITSTSGPPVFSSVLASTFAVISMRNESRSPEFHSSKILAMAGASSPATWVSRSYASAMSWMSAYSMPLCTIFT